MASPDLKLTNREVADVLRRRAARVRHKLNGPKLQVRRAKPKGGRERDIGFLSWLHEGLPCIACLRFGVTGSPIEAAHQKIQSAEKGLNRKYGVRPDDWQCVPLCAEHHRTGPLRCDPAQAKFWAIVGLEPSDVADFCGELFAAYQAGESGSAVVRRFATLAGQDPSPLRP